MVAWGGRKKPRFMWGAYANPSMVGSRAIVEPSKLTWHAGRLEQFRFIKRPAARKLHAFHADESKAAKTKWPGDLIQTAGNK